MFPINPVSDNDVIKPGMFVLKDMNVYNQSGKDVDAVYNTGLKKAKNPGKSVWTIRHKKLRKGIVVEKKVNF